MDSKQFLEALWLEENGDTTRVISRLRSESDTSKIPTALERRVREFNANYNCITIVDDSFSKVLTICRDNGILGGDSPLGAIPVLFRWNRGANDEEEQEIVDRIFNHREESVFLLDEEIRSYHCAPEGLRVIGFYSDAMGYHIIDETAGELLCTENEQEVLWFAVLTCEYLLVGAKTPVITPAFPVENSVKKKLFDTYLQMGATTTKSISEKGLRIMAFPGKPGCFANACFKAQNDPKNKIKMAFVDCWKDVQDIVESGKTDGGSDDGSSDDTAAD